MDLFSDISSNYNTFEIPRGFKFPSSKNALRILVDKFDGRLDEDIFVQRKTNITKTHVVLINPNDFTLSPESLERHTKAISKLCFPGDLDDIYFLAYLFHEAGRKGKIAEALGSMAFAFGAGIPELDFNEVPSLVNHNSVDSGLQVLIKDIKDYWNPEWSIIAHLNKPHSS